MTLDNVILKNYPEEKTALCSTMKRQGAAAVKVELWIEAKGHFHGFKD